AEARSRLLAGAVPDRAAAQEALVPGGQLVAVSRGVRDVVQADDPKRVRTIVDERLHVWLRLVLDQLPAEAAATRTRMEVEDTVAAIPVIPPGFKPLRAHRLGGLLD